jgi:unsaturated rhamnogalacturonyl hydrolase
VNPHSDLIEKIAQRTLNLSFQYTQADVAAKVPEAHRWFNWDWSIGVAFYGLGRVAAVLEPNYLVEIKKWVDARLQTADDLPVPCVNTTALLLTVLQLHKTFGDEKYEALCQKYDAYFLEQAERTPGGTLAHTVVGKIYPGEVWADTLFMGVLYLQQRGLLLDDQELLAEAMRQFELHLSCLFDRKSGLFYHGWDDLNKKPLGVKWGRGNAWVLVSFVEFAGRCPLVWAEWLEVMHRHIATLVSLQTVDGFWRTVLDEPETYPETSATAGIAYALIKGINLGLFDSKYLPVARKALDALVTKIDAEGNVLGGSSGTAIKANPLEYNQVPCRVTPFTQGLALLALTESLFLGD